MTHRNDRKPEAAELRKSRGISLVWLVPVVAVFIGGGIAWETLSNQGPTIELHFEDASGLEPGKTRIKYRDVAIGVITEIALSDDLTSVIAQAELVKDASPYLTARTRFWKVTPHVSLSGISGLETLVSGVYLNVLPEAGGDPQRVFEVLDEAPTTAAHRGAVAISLHAKSVGSLGPGAPLTYNGVRVGEVEKHRLMHDGKRFEVDAFVYRRFAHLIKPSTLFWNASGLSVSLGAEGLEIQTASLGTLLAGGIELANPKPAAGQEPVGKGARFVLHASHDEARKVMERSEGLNVTVEALVGSGIAEGAPVYYRKQKVGHVGSHRLSDDAVAILYQVHIEARYAPLVRSDSRFFDASGVKLHVGLDGLDLDTGSLASILEGGISFATPERPGERAEDGARFALHHDAEPEWLAWTPRIWIGDRPEQRIDHVVDVPTTRPRGLAIVLEAFSGASVKAGDPVTYRELEVGTIVERELSKDARTVRIHAEIEPEYARLVRSNTRFWNTSGIHAHLGLSGLEIDTGSLQSMLAGGVAFATPDEKGTPVRPGTLFPLHPKPEKEWMHWSPAVWMGPGEPSRPVEHAISDEHRIRHVEAESVEPELEVVPAVAIDAEVAPAPVGAEVPAPRAGFFRRLFGFAR
ncbi:MAG: MlaD family protein [Myxococcota bacterium]|nr:MlaD family protein [Myxococcota bacterium]